jgi:hypothetical protein
MENKNIDFPDQSFLRWMERNNIDCPTPVVLHNMYYNMINMLENDVPQVGILRGTIGGKYNGSPETLVALNDLVGPNATFCQAEDQSLVIEFSDVATARSWVWCMNLFVFPGQRAVTTMGEESDSLALAYSLFRLPMNFYHLAMYITDAQVFYVPDSEQWELAPGMEKTGMFEPPGYEREEFLVFIRRQIACLAATEE